MDIAKTSLQLVAFEQRPRPRRSEEPLGRSDCRKRGKMAVPAHAHGYAAALAHQRRGQGAVTRSASSPSGGPAERVSVIASMASVTRKGARLLRTDGQIGYWTIIADTPDCGSWLGIGDMGPNAWRYLYLLRSYWLSQRRAKPSRPCGMKMTMAMNIRPSGIR